MTMPLSRKEKALLIREIELHPDLTWLDLLDTSKPCKSVFTTAKLQQAAKNRYYFLRTIKARDPKKYWSFHKKALDDKFSNSDEEEDDQHHSTIMEDDMPYPDNYPSYGSPAATKKPPALVKSAAKRASGSASRGQRSAAATPTMKSPRATKTNVFSTLEEAIDVGKKFSFFLCFLFP